MSLNKSSLQFDGCISNKNLSQPQLKHEPNACTCAHINNKMNLIPFYY